MAFRGVFFLAILLHPTLLLVSNARAGNLRQLNPDKLPKQGLYADSNHVISLTFETVKSFIFEQKYATLVEFYNSYCGHCRRFAPKYNELAKNLSLWGPDILQVCAYDCSLEENSDVCREFEVMSYPTVRLFLPNTKEVNKTLGLELQIDLNTIPKDVIDNLKNLTDQKIIPEHFPSLQFLSQQRKEELFTDLPESVQFIFMFLENNSSYVGPHLAYDFHKVNEIRVRRIENSSLAQDLGLTPRHPLMCFKRGLTPVEFLEITDLSPLEDIRKSITNFLKLQNISLPPEVANRIYESTTEAHVSEITDILEKEQEAAIRNKVRENLGTVYLADLEQALKHLLFTEVPSHATALEGEAILALQRLITVIDRYFPFNANGKKFIKSVREYVMNNERITGQEFDAKMTELEKIVKPVFSSNRWVGCLGSKEGLRRYPCGLWTLFHFLTVQAADSELSFDPLEVLQAMHGYIKNFFGCTECSQHFQQMAARNKIWSVRTKEDAVLWLWQAHNEVNARLKGDLTEDPEFPKGQFPSEAACPDCRRPVNSAHGHTIIGEPNWDKTEVLLYLKRTNSPENLDLLGLQNEATRPRFMAQIGANRNASAFSDMDIRMGMLLYVACLVILVIAVKLLLRRGYRKKLYIHDLFGKV